MICSKCKSELKADAVVCLKCGQPVSSKPLGFPCVICGEPIPPGVEECTHCGGSVAKAPVNTASLADDLPAEKVQSDSADSLELDAFQLDDIAIAAPPPPPPPRRTQTAVDKFEPLPDLVPRDSTEQGEFPALGIELTPKQPSEAVPVPVAAQAPAPAVQSIPQAPVRPAVQPAPVARPAVAPAATVPVATAPQAVPVVTPVTEPTPALPPQLAPVPGVKPVRPGGQRPVVPGYSPPAAVAAPVPAVPRQAPAQAVPASGAARAPQALVLPAEGPIPPAAPIPELQAVRRPRVATLPPVDANKHLGPQPEDFVDADAARRRKTIITVLGGLFGFILMLGVIGYLVLAKPWHREAAEPESLQQRVDKQFTDNRLQAPTPLPSASPAVAAPVEAPASAPEAASAPIAVPASAPAVVPPPVAQPAPPAAVAPEPAPVAKPVVKREAPKAAPKPSRRSSSDEEDAYLRQIHRQLRQ